MKILSIGNSILITILNIPLITLILFGILFNSSSYFYNPSGQLLVLISIEIILEIALLIQFLLIYITNIKFNWYVILTTTIFVLLLILYFMNNASINMLIITLLSSILLLTKEKYLSE
ncbi:hypothetical protein WR164_00580 [Philodulcilactobacillus myokoensis]|uniref:Uncharacterized protein n=1 Tax=Philodulcilactobacillus myokoensis TaxID=2929573 RepID=A0A9W6B0U9_9LACO|nr:hypothetical protein WR164_00580 [Philodulcilactobacillus myokoensis]